jgi:hypothetical protein
MLDFHCQQLLMLLEVNVKLLLQFSNIGEMEFCQYFGSTHICRCHKPRRMLYDTIPRLSHIMTFLERDAYKVLDGNVIHKYTSFFCIILCRLHSEM